MLQTWAERISMHYWGVPLDLQIKFNGRLKRCFGWFIVETHNPGNKKVKRVEISKVLVKGNMENAKIVELILKHELCHWYLYTYNGQKEFSDGDKRFEDEIVRIQSISQSEITSRRIKVNRADKVK